MCMCKRRSVLAIILAIILIAINVIPANAAVSEPEMSPMALYYTDAYTELSISSKGVAKITSSMIGNDDTTKVKVTLFLQKYSGGKWTTVKEWDDSKSSQNLTTVKSTDVSKGYEYRTQATFTVYSGLKYTKVLKYSGTVSY